jgi:hypothetical protein
MTLKSFFLGLFAVLFSVQLAFAHGAGHGGHAITDEVAITTASENLTLLIEQKVEIESTVLDGSWGALSDASKAIYQKGEGYVIVSFDNAAEGKTLYILLSDQGEFFEANYSGKFDSLKQ